MNVVLALSYVPWDTPGPEDYVGMLAGFLGILVAAFLILNYLSNRVMGWASQHLRYRVPVVTLMGSLWTLWMLYLVHAVLYWGVLLYLWYTDPIG